MATPNYLGVTRSHLLARLRCVASGGERLRWDALGRAVRPTSEAAIALARLPRSAHVQTFQHPSVCTAHLPSCAHVHTARRPRRLCWSASAGGLPPCFATPRTRQDVVSAEAPWQLVQMAELIRRAEDLHLATLGLLGLEARAEIPEGAAAVVKHPSVLAIAGCVADAADIAEQLDALGRALPDDAVSITYEAVRDAAATDLAGGILDPHRAITAARVLDVQTGWPALAEALRVEAPANWDDLAVVDVLAQFRGAERQLVKRVLDDAGIPPDRSFADCSPEALLRLATGLDTASGLRR